MLPLSSETLIVARVERRRTLRDTDRIKNLEAQLDAVIAEGRRLRAQIEEFSPGRLVPDLREMVRKQSRRNSLL
jgi:cell division protein FtsB